MSHRRAWRVLGLLPAALAAGATPALACTVCYAGADTDMTAGMNAGILTLLLAVGVVQVGFVALFVSFWRRARRLRRRRAQFQLIDGGVR